MGSNHDVNLAIGEVTLGICGFFATHHARQLPHTNGPAAEALTKGLKVLAGQQGRGANHRNLPATHRHDKGCAQGDFCLAKAHVATNQAVHRMACGEIIEDVFNRRQLIVSLIPREAGTEFIIIARARQNRLRHFCRACCRNLDQRFGHIFQTLLGLRLTALPCHTAQFVQKCGRIFRAIA